MHAEWHALSPEEKERAKAERERQKKIQNKVAKAPTPTPAAATRSQKRKKVAAVESSQEAEMTSDEEVPMKPPAKKRKSE